MFLSLFIKCSMFIIYISPYLVCPHDGTQIAKSCFKKHTSVQRNKRRPTDYYGPIGPSECHRQRQWFCGTEAALEMENIYMSINIYMYVRVYVSFGCCPFISCSARSNIYMVLRGAPCLSHRCCAMRMDGWNDIRSIPVDNVEDDDARTTHTHTQKQEIIPNHPCCVAYDWCMNVWVCTTLFAHPFSSRSAIPFGVWDMRSRCWPLLAVAGRVGHRALTVKRRYRFRTPSVLVLHKWYRFGHDKCIYTLCVCVFFLLPFCFLLLFGGRFWPSRNIRYMLLSNGRSLFYFPIT